MNEDSVHLAGMPRWLAGACGGIAACLAQCLGQHQAETISGYAGRGEWGNVKVQLMAIGIGLIILMILASFVALFSPEKSRQKLFMMGIAVPALATTAYPGIQHYASILSPAYAAESSQPCPASSQITLSQGLKNFFGLDEQKYRVVVGSFKKPEDASAVAARINSDDPTAKAVVGDRAPCNEFYSVTIGNGDFFPVEKAKILQAKALQINSVNGAYLSPQR